MENVPINNRMKHGQERLICPLLEKRDYLEDQESAAGPSFLYDINFIEK